MSWMPVIQAVAQMVATLIEIIRNDKPEIAQSVVYAELVTIENSLAKLKDVDAAEWASVGGRR